MNRNMLIRIIVAVIFGPMIILISYLGGYWLLGLIFLLAAIGIGEFLIGGGFKPSSLIFVVTVLFTVGMVITSALISFTLSATLFVCYFLLIGMLLAIRRQPPAELFSHMTTLSWGVAYIGLLYPFLYHIRELSEIGGDWLFFLFGTLWLTDSMAMWVGGALGKRKFAPTVSPGKTVAGFIGGLCGGVVVAFVFWFWRLSGYDLIILIVAGSLVSFIGQLGDLVESCWKRAINIKDSSAIIPGHGGVLDRFDSLLFAASVLFWFLRYFVYN